MKIYTKTGDKGTTSLYGGVKVSKAHMRIEAYGTTDELNSFIGLILSYNKDDKVKQELQTIQKDLFVLGAELATPNEKLYLANGKSRIGKMVQDSSITYLEQWIDAWEEELTPLTHFILPGGGQGAATAHVARTVCRRAERIVVAVSENIELRPELQRYLNRLSDYLFVIARVLSKLNNENEVKWIPEKE